MSAPTMSPVQFASASQVAYVTTLALRWGHSLSPEKLATAERSKVRETIAAYNAGLAKADLAGKTVAAHQEKVLAAVADLMNVEVPFAEDAKAADELIIAWAKKATAEDVAYINETVRNEPVTF